MPAYVRHPEVVYTDLEDGAVLLHSETKFFYSLDQVGVTIWRTLDGTGSPEGLIRRLQLEYDVSPELARESVNSFLDSLEREQLVARSEQPLEIADVSGGEPAPAQKRPFAQPELLKHDEPLHAVVMNPFDPQLPLAE